MEMLIFFETRVCSKPFKTKNFWRITKDYKCSTTPKSPNYHKNSTINTIIYYILCKKREMKKKNQKLKIMFPIIQIFRSHY